jgi:hypothetical protein
MRLSSGRRTPRLMPSSLNEAGARRPIFRVHLSDQSDRSFGFVTGLNIVSAIVTLRGFQLTIATRRNRQVEMTGILPAVCVELLVSRTSSFGSRATWETWRKAQHQLCRMRRPSRHFQHASAAA